MTETALPRTVAETAELLARGNYVADRALATSVHLALAMGRPLFLEGEPGTGKTEIAKVLAEQLGRRLVRLQCYDGLDLAAAAYEWDHARQLMEIRLAESAAPAAPPCARRCILPNSCSAGRCSRRSIRACRPPSC
ncbi:unnamed protein product [Acidocella sp. C78]|nr:unnamed protein product [Acidocella sp. C78]